MPLSAEVRRERRAFNNPLPPPEKAVCENCGRTYTKAPRREDQRFCSDACRKAWHRLGTAYPKVQHELTKMVQAEFDTRATYLGSVFDQMKIAWEQLNQLRAEHATLAKSVARLQGQYDRLLSKARKAKALEKGEPLNRRRR